MDIDDVWAQNEDFRARSIAGRLQADGMSNARLLAEGMSDDVLWDLATEGRRNLAEAAQQETDETLAVSIVVLPGAYAVLMAEELLARRFDTDGFTIEAMTSDVPVPYDQDAS